MILSLGFDKSSKVADHIVDYTVANHEIALDYLMNIPFLFIISTVYFSFPFFIPFAFAPPPASPEILLKIYVYSTPTTPRVIIKHFIHNHVTSMLEYSYLSVL